ncbi:MAG: hypothetical protein WCD35_15640 [Mycobacteriales bacterium]
MAAVMMVALLSAHAEAAPPTIRQTLAQLIQQNGSVVSTERHGRQTTPATTYTTGRCSIRTPRLDNAWQYAHTSTMSSGGMEMVFRTTADAQAYQRAMFAWNRCTAGLERRAWRGWLTTVSSHGRTVQLWTVEEAAKDNSGTRNQAETMARYGTVVVLVGIRNATATPLVQRYAAATTAISLALLDYASSYGFDALVRRA